MARCTGTRREMPCLCIFAYAGPVREKKRGRREDRRDTIHSGPANRRGGPSVCSGIQAAGFDPAVARTRVPLLGLAGAAALLASVASPALAERPGKPALETLLRAFAERRDEKVLQTIPSIEWNGVSYPNDSEKDNSYAYVLQGRLRLIGFGEVDVPVGVGAEQTTRKADEGEVSFEVRFSNASNPAIRGPLQITMIKLHPSADHRAVLERNLPGARVQLLADACTRDSLGRP